jgi:site-specific DNA recombinase
MPTFNSEEYLVKKVGGYARVSTFEQAEKGTSIYEQKRLIIEECLKRGWQLVKIYCDEGVSGRMTHRQGLSELQRDAQMGLFQIIMFTKSDRIARSIRDLSNLWHDWTEWGLEIICVEQPEINSNGIYGKMLRNLLGIFAEWERDIIIERTTSGRMARWRNTESIMGALPYGYEFDRNNRTIVLHPEKAIICKRIFRMFLHHDLGAREIALRLSKASIPSPRGKIKWHFATIIRILKNPAYTGKSELNMYKIEYTISRNDLQYKRRSKEKKDRSKWITIEFPPIISQRSHHKILEKMKLNSTSFKRGNKCNGKFFLLENIHVTCGECG